MAKTTIVAAMFTLCERGTESVVVAGGERWWRQRRGKTVGLEKREKRGDEQTASFNYQSIGRLVVASARTNDQGMENTLFVSMLD